MEVSRERVTGQLFWDGIGIRVTDEIYSKAGDDSGHDVENLGISCGGHILLIIAENGVEKSGDKVGIDLVEILRLFDVGLDELEDFLFDGSETSNLGSFGGNETYRKEDALSGFPIQSTMS